MKKVHRKLTEEENSSQCPKVLAQVTTEKTRMGGGILRQRQQTYFDKRLCYLKCSSFFFYKDQRRKDGTDFETNMVSSFQSAPVLHWRAKPYSALSFDRVNVFSMAHLFSLSRKPFVMSYCFRETIKLSFLTPVKWLSNRVSCSFFPVPQTGSHIINILLASFSSSVPSP